MTTQFGRPENMGRWQGLGYHSFASSAAIKEPTLSPEEVARRNTMRKAVIARWEAIMVIASDKLQVVAPTHKSMQAISIAVCEQRGLPWRQIFDNSRHQPLVHARHEIWWRSRNELGYSLTRIGRWFHVDHTTVMHGCRMHAKRMSEGAA